MNDGGKQPNYAKIRVYFTKWINDKQSIYKIKKTRINKWEEEQKWRQRKENNIIKHSSN